MDQHMELIYDRATSHNSYSAYYSQSLKAVIQLETVTNNISKQYGGARLLWAFTQSQ